MNFLVLNNFVFEVNIDTNPDVLIKNFYSYSYKEVKQSIVSEKKDCYYKDNFAWYITKDSLFSFTGKTLQDLEHITNIFEYLKKNKVKINNPFIYLDLSKNKYNLESLNLNAFLSNITNFSLKDTFKLNGNILKLKIFEKHPSDFNLRNWFYLFHEIINSESVPSKFDDIIDLYEDQKFVEWINYRVLLFSKDENLKIKAKKNLGIKSLFC